MFAYLSLNGSHLVTQISNIHAHARQLVFLALLKILERHDAVSIDCLRIFPGLESFASAATLHRLQERDHAWRQYLGKRIDRKLLYLVE